MAPIDCFSLRIYSICGILACFTARVKICRPPKVASIDFVRTVSGCLYPNVMEFLYLLMLVILFSN